MESYDQVQTPNPIDVEVGRRIRVRPKWLAISQSALAATLGGSFQQVQEYEPARIGSRP